MRYFASWLIYLAVLARAAGWNLDSPTIPGLIWAQLAAFGMILLLEPRLTRYWPTFPRLYVLVQSALLIAMLYTAPNLDFLSLLFFPLSFQAVQSFGVRAGFAWIGVFSLSMAGMLFSGMEWKPGMMMLLLASAANGLIGSFAVLMDRTERDRRENQRLFGELQTAYHHLSEYANQAEALAAAEERHRMVRELHDSLTQTLFSMNLAVQAAQLAAGQSPPQTLQHLRRLQTLARSAASELQALAGPSLTQGRMRGGLAAALKRLIGERQLQDGLQVTLEIAGTDQEDAAAVGATWLSEKAQINLYHIAQEALNNVAKHARTARAVVRLNLARRPARLEVQDDGCGFDLGNPQRRSGFGLGEMAERAGEIGWEIIIDSAPGRGTRICVREKAP